MVWRGAGGGEAKLITERGCATFERCLACSQSVMGICNGYSMGNFLYSWGGGGGGAQDEVIVWAGHTVAVPSKAWERG